MKAIEKCNKRIRSIFLCLVMTLSMVPSSGIIHVHAAEDLSYIIGDKGADYTFYVHDSLGGLNDYTEDGTFCIYYENQDDLKDGKPSLFLREQEGNFKGSGNWSWSSETVYFAYYFPKGTANEVGDNFEIQLYHKSDERDNTTDRVPIENVSGVSYKVELIDDIPDWMSSNGIDCKTPICLVTITGLTRENLGTGELAPYKAPEIMINGY